MPHARVQTGSGTAMQTSNMTTVGMRYTCPLFCDYLTGNSRYEQSEESRILLPDPCLQE
jgi:hypothetical protein